jgi:hypothetical protein
VTEVEDIENQQQPEKPMNIIQGNFEVPANPAPNSFQEDSSDDYIGQEIQLDEINLDIAEREIKTDEHGSPGHIEQIRAI